MNRDHKVYTYSVSYDFDVRIPDPPGSGEMRKVAISRDSATIVVVAPSEPVARCWLTGNPYRFPNLEIHGMTEAKINAVIELHTY